MFLLIVGSLAVRAGLDARSAWWVAALVAVMPAVYAGAHSGFVDTIYAGFVLAAARIGFDAKGIRDYVVFGLFCGLCHGNEVHRLDGTSAPGVLFSLGDSEQKEWGFKLGVEVCGNGDCSCRRSFCTFLYTKLGTSRLPDLPSDACPCALFSH